MLKNHGIRYLLAVLVALVLSTGFLGCGGGSGGTTSESPSSNSTEGPNSNKPDDPGSNNPEGTGNNPCTITFTSPVNGTVLEKGTTTVTIKGYITAGDSAAQSLTADGLAIPFNATTGAFSYTYAIKPGAISSTSTLAVTDKNNVTNKNRISFAVGQSLEAGATNVVANAARMVVTEGYMDAFERIIPAYVGKWKYDMIYGYTHATYGSKNTNSPYAGKTALIPMTIPVTYQGLSMGSLVIDNARSGKQQGFINIGPISMAFDIQSDNTILTDITIASASGINPRSAAADAAIFIQGYHQNLLLGNPYFAFYATGVSITGAKLTLSMDAANQIVATLDTTAANISFTGANYEYGVLEIPTWLSAEITKMVESTLKSAIDVPIMDANSIAMTVGGITTGGWPMNPARLFTSTDTSLAMDLGLYAVLKDPAAALIRGLTKFYATPDDALPNITLQGSENIDLAMTDDIMNNYAYIAVQSGQLKNIDITAAVKEELIYDLGKDLAYAVTPSNFRVTATLETPPIFDFSTNTAGTAANAYTAGGIIIRNLLVNISFDTIDGTSHVMKLSADVDGPLMLALDDSGYLVGGVDATDSTSSIMTLYNSDVNAQLVPTVKGVLANVALNRVLQRMIKIKPPAALDLYGVNIGYRVAATEVSDNCLIIKGVVSY